MRGTHPNQDSSHIAVSNAVRDGTLPVPQHCLVCGTTDEAIRASRPIHTTQRQIKYHHPSYELGFELCVVPLCSSCHQLVHAGRIPDPGVEVMKTYHPRFLFVPECEPPHRAPTLGDLLRLLRRERRLTREGLARRVEVNVSTIALYEEMPVKRPRLVDAFTYALGASEVDCESAEWLARTPRQPWHPDGALWQGIPAQKPTREERAALSTIKRRGPYTRRRSAA